MNVRQVLHTMKLALIRIALAGLLAAPASWALADESAARATMERFFPGRPIQTIMATPVAGLYEAAVDGRLFYVTEDGRHILIGPLIDARTGVNLTESRMEEISAIPWERLPLKLAFKRTKGNGSRRIAIFASADRRRGHTWTPPVCKTIFHCWRVDGILSGFGEPCRRRRLVTAWRLQSRIGEGACSHHSRQPCNCTMKSSRDQSSDWRAAQA